MFDGALPGTLDDQLHAADSKTLPSDPSTSTWSFTPLVDDPVQVRAVDPSLNNGRKEVAFIDTGVAGYQALVAGVRAGVEVVLLDVGQDGLAQMARWAQSHSGYDAVHVLSHASDAVIHLGQASITTASLSEATTRQALQTLGQALTPEGDLLFYGCDLTAGLEGVALVGRLAELSGADIGASTDATGSSVLGADWMLETEVGAVETRLFQIDAYTKTLAAGTITFTAAPGSTTATDGSGGSSDISGITIQITSDQNLNWTYETAYSRGVIAVNYSNGSGDGTQSLITIKSSSSGTNFWFKGLFIADLGSSQNIRAEGFDNGVSTGFVLLSSHSGGNWGVGTYQPESTYTTDIFLPSIFQNVDEIKITPTTGIPMAIALNDIVIADPVSGPSVSSINRVGASALTNASSVNYTVTFSESVTGVDVSDFTLTSTGTGSGTIAGVTGSGSVYTVTVNTVAGDGTLRLDLKSSGTGIQNGSSQAIASGFTSGQTYTLDHTVPASPSTPDLASASDSGSSTTDNITNVTAPIFTGTAESGSAVTLYDSDGTTVLGTGTATGGSWSITSSTLSSGSHTLTAKATDAAGNVGTASAALSVVVDTTAPSALALGTSSVANTLATSGATLATLSATDANAVSYSLVAGTGSTNNGSFTIAGTDLKVGASNLTAGSYSIRLRAADAAGNTSEQQFTFTVTSGPSVASINRVGSTPSNATSVDYTVTFNESVTGVDASDFTLTATGTANGNVSNVSGSGTTYTVTVGSLSGDGTLRLDLKNSGTGIQNGGSQAITGGYASGQTYTLDNTRPTASLVVSDSALAVGETSLVTITFSEAVTGFTNADLTVANGTLSSVSSSNGGITWTATLTPSASVTVATNLITLNNTGVADLVGNTGTGTTDSGNYSIDTVRPTAGIVVADTALVIGETSLVTITFSEAVTGFTNADLTVANGTLSAVSSGDGGVTWAATLTPTVSVADATNVITLNNTGVQDAVGNAGTGTTDSNNYAIDTAASAVTSVSVPANATYVSGQNLDLTVNFNENVTVDTTGGTPRIALTVGTSTVYASYLSGSGTTALVFRYTIASGELDSNGIAVGALAANGGSLKDAAGNDATLTLNSVGSTSAVLVDAVVPTVTSVSVPANGFYRAGQNLDLTVNFSENITVNTGGGTPRVALTVGSSTVDAAYVSGSGTSALVFRHTVQANALDTDGIAVGSLSANGGTLRDAAGNDATLTLNSVSSTTSVNVDAVAPTSVALSSTALMQVNSGTQTTVATLSATDDSTVTYALASGNGSNDAQNSSFTIAGTNLKSNAVLNAGTYNIRVSATDAAGNVSYQSFSITVTSNTAPTITSGSAGTVAENAAISTVVYTATATDVDAGQTLSYSLTGTDAGSFDINASTGVVTLKASANYEAKASYSFNVVATDNGTGSLTDTKAVTVTVTDVNDPTTGLLAVAGEARQGQTLTVIDTLADQDGISGKTYQWLADGVAIQGATQASFLLELAQAGKQISVQVRYTDSVNRIETLTSVSTSAVIGLVPLVSRSEVFMPAVISSALPAVDPSVMMSAIPVNLVNVPVAAPMFLTFERDVRPDVAADARTLQGFSVPVVNRGSTTLPEVLVLRNMADQSATRVGNQLIVNFDVPATTFAHTDPSASVTLRAALADGRPLPGWLKFNPITGEFRGIAPENYEGSLEITVVATDNNGSKAVTRFRVDLTGKSDKTSDAGKPRLQAEMMSQSSFAWKAERDAWIRHAREASKVNRTAEAT